MTPSRQASGPERLSPPDRDGLRRENERLRSQVERLRQQLSEQAEQLGRKEQQITDAGKQITDAEKKIADLERQLALRLQNSTTSSKPPSSDGLAGGPRERGRRTKSKRKVGGQPGHRGAHRPLVPADRVDEIRSVLPLQCGKCGHALPQALDEAETDGSAQRHQVTELPPMRAHISEYQCHRVICPECGEGTRAALPEEAAGQFGPQLTALIVYLTVVCRMPRRVVEAMLQQALAIRHQFGEHAEMLGRSQSGRRRALWGTGGAVEG